MTPIPTAGSVGENAILGCAPPEGHPSPVVRWIKDGEFLDLSSANKYQVSQVCFGLLRSFWSWCLTDAVQIVGPGNLVISSLAGSDAGRYRCSARNLAGTRETPAAQLSVHGEPTLNNPGGSGEICFVKSGNIVTQQSLSVVR